MKVKMGTITYSLLIIAALFLLIVAFFGLIYRQHLIIDFFEGIRHNEIQISSKDGISFNLNASKRDREIAWELYTQIKTRIAAEEFNDEYDSFLHVNSSLHDLFLIIRDRIAQLPIAVITTEGNQIAEFYLDILNRGIRPYLSKWHIPISSFHEVESRRDPDLSVLDIEKSFPNRVEILCEMKMLNLRMKKYSVILLSIAQGKNSNMDLSYDNPNGCPKMEKPSQEKTGK